MWRHQRHLVRCSQRAAARCGCGPPRGCSVQRRVVTGGASRALHERPEHRSCFVLCGVWEGAGCMGDEKSQQGKVIYVYSHHDSAETPTSRRFAAMNSRLDKLRCVRSPTSRPVRQAAGLTNCFPCRGRLQGNAKVAPAAPEVQHDRVQDCRPAGLQRQFAVRTSPVMATCQHTCSRAPRRWPGSTT